MGFQKIIKLLKINKQNSSYRHLKLRHHSACIVIYVESISWRDMWALVTVKGAEAIAEDVGKSIDTASWGSKVTVDATISLKDASGVCSKCVWCGVSVYHLLTAFECDWPATAENIRRKAFCSKYEGYGQLCDCATPISLSLSPPSVSPSHPHTSHTLHSLTVLS